MKHLLLLIGICLSALFLPSLESTEGDKDLYGLVYETVMDEEDEARDMQQRIEAIGNDLKGSQCLTPRRVVQPTSQIIDLRVVQQGSKLLQLFRLKQEEGLSKLSHHIFSRQSTYLSALTFRMARQVFALRKLIL